MPGSARKRPRPEVEENRADCPFTVTIESEFNKKAPKRRKSGKDAPEPPRKIYRQLSPFSPIGQFKTHETLDIDYAVEPSAKWQEMTRYNSFVRKLAPPSPLIAIALSAPPARAYYPRHMCTADTTAH
ncbi:hypothetical protein IMZ48_24080 [Candidatus Bathyarchaeota archaeon]|nr:hypothetical protein [Candidatus Bathyarchaeota archaeon]